MTRNSKCFSFNLSILTVSLFSLYVHGGRDLKEGSHSSMWRVSLTGIRELNTDPFYPVEWELVTTHGQGLGKISHHTASVHGPREVIFYGGLFGEDNNS